LDRIAFLFLLVAVIDCNDGNGSGGGISLEDMVLDDFGSIFSSVLTSLFQFSSVHIAYN
jgi:hypothetical protein